MFLGGTTVNVSGQYSTMYAIRQLNLKLIAMIVESDPSPSPVAL